MMSRPALCAIALAFAPMCLGAEADWPQWRGPNRDGYAAPQPLLQQWPAGGPQIKWGFRGASVGYSAFSIRDDRLYTMGTRDDGTYTICLDTTKGEMIWETRISRAATSEDYDHGFGGGPRSTPTIDGDFIYALSDVGVLACLTAELGEIAWSVDFVADFESPIPNWGFSESVLVDGDRVIATPGGASFMVGLDKKSGEKVWASEGFEDSAQYVSPIRHSIGDVSFYVTASKSGLSAFDTETGKLLFKNAATGNGVAVVTTPIVHENLLYHTSAYGAGNVLLRLTSGDNRTLKAEMLYHLSTKSMQNHHGGVVLVDGVIYGAVKEAWMAQDLQTGETLWEERVRPNRSGSIAYADGRLYCYNDQDATLFLVEPNREAFNKVGELKLPETTKHQRGERDSGAIWAHPVIADGTLYLRDQDLIFAFDIAR